MRENKQKTSVVQRNRFLKYFFRKAKRFPSGHFSNDPLLTFPSFSYSPWLFKPFFNLLKSPVLKCLMLSNTRQPWVFFLWAPAVPKLQKRKKSKAPLLKETEVTSGGNTSSWEVMAAMFSNRFLPFPWLMRGLLNDQRQNCGRSQ